MPNQSCQFLVVQVSMQFLRLFEFIHDEGRGNKTKGRNDKVKDPEVIHTTKQCWNGAKCPRVDCYFLHPGEEQPRAYRLNQKVGIKSCSTPEKRGEKKYKLKMDEGRSFGGNNGGNRAKSPHEKDNRERKDSRQAEKKREHVEDLRRNDYKNKYSDDWKREKYEYLYKEKSGNGRNNWRDSSKCNQKEYWKSRR